MVFVAQLMIKPPKIMELELGLKLTRVADEFSSADFLLAKDRAGPLFISTETDTMFVLTVHLKGYRKENIKIEINEDGSRIIISGEKLVQETLMVGWKLVKKETEKREFKKAFKIPDGVILDKIQARFNDDEFILTISMPKKVKGIRGHSIEEVKEQEIAREGSGTLQIVPDEVPKEGNVLEERKGEYAEIVPDEVPEEGNVLEETKGESGEQSGLSEENALKLSEIPSAQEPVESGFNDENPEETKKAEVHGVKQEKLKEIQEDRNERLQKASSGTDTIEEIKNFPGEGSGEATAKASIAESEKQEISQSNEGKTEKEHNECPHLEQEIVQYQHKNYQHDRKENDMQGNKVDESALVNPTDKAQRQEDVPSGTQEERERFKICAPILAGSALLLSLVAFVVHFIRTKSQPGKRQD